MSAFSGDISAFIAQKNTEAEQVSDMFRMISGALKDTGNVNGFIDSATKDIKTTPGSDEEASLNAMKKVLETLGEGVRKTANRNRTDSVKVWAGLEKGFEISTKNPNPEFSKADLSGPILVPTTIPSSSTTVTTTYPKAVYTKGDVTALVNGVTGDVANLGAKFNDAYDVIKDLRKREATALKRVLNAYEDDGTVKTPEAEMKLNDDLKKIRRDFQEQRNAEKAQLRSNYSKVVNKLSELKQVALQVLSGTAEYSAAGLKKTGDIDTRQLLRDIEELSQDVQESARKTAEFSPSLSRALLDLYAGSSMA